MAAIKQLLECGVSGLLGAVFGASIVFSTVGGPLSNYSIGAGLGFIVGAAEGLGILEWLGRWY